MPPNRITTDDHATMMEAHLESFWARRYSPLHKNHDRYHNFPNGGMSNRSKQARRKSRSPFEQIIAVFGSRGKSALCSSFKGHCEEFVRFAQFGGENILIPDDNHLHRQTPLQSCFSSLLPDMHCIELQPSFRGVNERRRRGQRRRPRPR